MSKRDDAVKIEVTADAVNEVIERIRASFDDPSSLLASAAEVAEMRDDAVRMLAEMVNALSSVIYSAGKNGELDHRPALIDVLTRSPAPEYYANELTVFVQRMDVLIPAAKLLIEEAAKRKAKAREFSTAILEKVSE